MRTCFLIFVSVFLCFNFEINAQTILLGPQPFNSDVLTHGSSAPTTAWFAPSSNTAISYVASGGNPGGYAGYSSSWNSYWGNFLRLPQVNCTGRDTVVLSFDFCNSYFAAQPNDQIRFYLWDQGGSAYHNDVSSVKINGVESMVNFGANGYGFRFNVALTWARVEVKYFLSNVTNKSNVLFYIEPSCGYNNSNVYFVKFDNIQVATVAAPVAPNVTGHTNDTAVCAGSMLKLKVHASGTAPLSFTWKRNGTSIGTFSDSTLSIPNTGPLNAGTYRCIVTNSLGSDSTSLINVSVNTAPTAMMLTPDTAICEGSNAFLRAHINSFTPMNLGWYFNNVFQSAATDSVYTITNALPAQNGHYYINAINACGSSFSDTISLTINPRPVPFIGNDTMVCSGSSILLDAGADYSQYNWSTGSNLEFITADTNGFGTGIRTYTVTVTNNNQCTGSAGIDINFDICSGVTEEYSNRNFSVYPNPAKEIISIHFDDGISTIEVFDATGHLLISKNYQQAHYTDLDISALTSGIFTIRINKIIIQKIIK
ncbi:MAG: immunoglobulin domain-containing protein [Bacteroidota bacterium]